MDFGFPFLLSVPKSFRTHFDAYESIVEDGYYSGCYTLNIHEEENEFYWNDAMLEAEWLANFKADKFVINCETEEARRLLNYLNYHNTQWKSGESLKLEFKFDNDEYYNCYHCITIDKKSRLEYGAIADFKNCEIIKFRNLIMPELKEKYCSTLEDFNGHEWVKFYEDKQGQPNVEWYEGCSDTGIEEFEQRVLDEYGDDKENLIYRTYMLESDKLRLALKLPARTIGIYQNEQNKFNFLLYLKRKELANFIGNTLIKTREGSNEDYYNPKNIMWCAEAFRNMCDSTKFKYLIAENSEEDDRYYDLVTLEYLDNNFAIPVPVLANILKIENEAIYDCFDDVEYRDDICFI